MSQTRSQRCADGSSRLSSLACHAAHVAAEAPAGNSRIELYDAVVLEQLSADPELLAVVGSWRDTLNDDEILEHLKSFNTTGKVLHTRQ
jgi:hypothetical protein